MSKLAVIDASFAGGWLIPDEFSPESEIILQHIFQGTLEMAVPAIWPYEVCNLIRSAMLRQRVKEPEVSDAMDLFVRIPFQTFDHHHALFRSRMMILSERFNLSVYDAAYLELADRLQCPLHTHDKPLREAAQALGLLG